MPSIEKLMTPEQLARNEELRQLITGTWASRQLPDRESLIEVGNIDTHEIVNAFGGKSFSELPSDDGYFCTFTPFSDMTLEAGGYYIGGYMLNALMLASKAGENEWLGMDLPVVVTIAFLTKQYDEVDRLFSGDQRKCVCEFLQFVRDHAEFFFYDDKIYELDQSIQKACRRA
jgi:hypothetical protein